MSGSRGNETAGGAELVELAVPALPELLSLPRLTAAAVAARAGFNLDEVEDIRLATEELCLAAFDGRGPGRLSIRLQTFPTTLEVACTFEPANGWAPPNPPRGKLAKELTEQLLEALTDEHGTDVNSGVPRAWFRKSRDKRSA